MKKVFAIVATFTLLLGVIIYSYMLSSLVAERSVLSGTVTWVIPKGESVSIGTELVRIRTKTGEIATAYSSVEGVIQEVLVDKDREIKSGAVVVKIAKSR